MALGTLGTVANNTLPSLRWRPGVSQADIATIARNIKDQSNPTHPIWPGGFTNEGKLFLPNGRGTILLKPGDVIAYDNFGWPVVVSSESLAGGASWVLA